MKKLLALFLFLVSAHAAFAQATSQLPATVPGSGTPFDFDSAVSNTAPYWPLVRLWDGTTKMTVVPLGQADSAHGIPVTPSATTYSQDPCYLQKKTLVTLTSNSTGPLQLIPAALGAYIDICSIVVAPTAATVFNLVEGVGTNCTGGSPIQQVVVGSLTPASGMPLAVGPPLSLGAGIGSVWPLHTAADALCFTQTVAENLSITISYVQTGL